MNKYILMMMAAGLVAFPAFVTTAQAEDAAVEVEAAADAAVDEVVEAELADGTKVHIKGDAVSVVDAEGNETPAPDGTHELSDGTHVTTEGGMIVHEADDTEHGDSHE